MYVTDPAANLLVRISPDGVITTVASGLNVPIGVFVDQSDNVFVSLFGNFAPVGATVLRFAPDGTQEVFATGGGLADVIGVAGDENGQIFACNWSTGQVFNITSGTAVFIGNVGIQCNHIDYAMGYLYVAANGVVQRINVETGVAELFSGSPALVESVDGTRENARFGGVGSTAVSPDQSILYIQEPGTGNIRAIAEEGQF